MILSLLACTWVGPKALDERLRTVDDDGDGVLAADDCNDQDAAIFPGATETWYDGVDGDCGGDDDFDSDADGHGASAFGGDDCDDVDPAVYPGAPEVPYDGVDNDCAGGDLVDVDADGSDWPVDCDDEDASTHPGAEETWYDGVDSDCAGDDDYDQDGDGAPSDLHGGGDCDDLDAGIYPGAPDAWYDGVDSDCAGDDDWDQDLDGYQDPSGGGDDCDDTRADVHVDALETVGDALDADCDGTPDGFRLRAVAGWTFAEARSPLLVAEAGTAWLSVLATEATSGPTYYDAGVAWSLDPSADPALTGQSPWLGNTSDPAYVTGATQAWTRAGERWFGVAGLIGVTRTLVLRAADGDAGTRVSATSSSGSVAEPFTGVSLATFGDTRLEALGCDATAAVLSWARVSSLDSGAVDAALEVEGVASPACSFDAAGSAWAAPDGVLTRYTFAEDVDGWHATAEPVSVLRPLTLEPVGSGLGGLDESGQVFTWTESGGLSIWRATDAWIAADVLPDGSAAGVVDAAGGVSWLASDWSEVPLTSELWASSVAVAEPTGWRVAVVAGPDGVAMGWAARE